MRKFIWILCFSMSLTGCVSNSVPSRELGKQQAKGDEHINYKLFTEPYLRSGLGVP